MMMKAQGLFEALFDEAAEAIFLVDRAGRIVLMNRTCESLFAYPPSELLGSPIEILVPERLRGGHSGHREKFQANPKRRPMGTGLELMGRRKDGTEFPVDITLSAHGSDGETLCVVRDMTERVAHEGFERALLSATTCGIVMADPNGLVRSFNRGAELLWGYSASEVVGARRMSDLCPRAAEFIALEGERDETITRRDGTQVPVRVSVTQLNRLGRPQGICCIVVDMTEHEEARKALRNAYDARSRFFARASHELRTPLNAILGFGQLLSEETAGQLSPSAARYLERVRAGGERLLRLTNDLLELSRWEMGSQTLNLEVFDAEPFLDEVLADFRPEAARHDMDFDWKAEHGLTIEADRLRMGQVVMNLVANALKFTPKGGRVKVEATSADGGVCLAVTDDGPGIPPESRAHIFEEFFQIQGAGRAANAGTGLGLPIAKKLVEAHGGQLTLESELGRGSCFRVYLRRAANS